MSKNFKSKAEIIGHLAKSGHDIHDPEVVAEYRKLLRSTDEGKDLPLIEGREIPDRIGLNEAIKNILGVTSIISPLGYALWSEHATDDLPLMKPATS